MQLFKNKKICIACILLLVALLAIIAIIIVNETGKVDSEGKRLVDTIGKDSGNSAKVYITADQNLVVEFENAEYAKLTLSKSELPVYDSQAISEWNSSTINYEVMIYNKNTTPQDVAPITYPCECELEFNSIVLGLKYTVKFRVDDKVKYISGSMERKEVDKTEISGYSEYSKTYGDIKLPDNATLFSFENTERAFTVADANTSIEVGLCEYMYEGAKKQIIVTKPENQELLYKIYRDKSNKKLKVNDVEVYILEERGIYIACYTYKNMVYVNYGFCVEKEGIDDNALIEALKPFI